MFSKIIFSIAISVVLGFHFLLLSSKEKQVKKTVVSQPSSISKISIQKVVLKKREAQKAQEKKEEQKVAKKPPLKNDFKKIVKESKNKVVKEVKEKIVKKVETKKQKEIKKTITKQESSIQKQTLAKKEKKLISNEKKDFIENEYLSKLREIIEQNKTYPKRAKRLKQEGRVVVSFEILQDGTIRQINIKDPSKFKRLNSAALDLLQGISKFKPIPKELEKNRWVIELPINYSIYS